MLSEHMTNGRTMANKSIYIRGGGKLNYNLIVSHQFAPQQAIMLRSVIQGQLYILQLCNN